MSDVKILQAHLLAIGFEPGKIDGVPGPKTMLAVWQAIAARKMRWSDDLVADLRFELARLYMANEGEVPPADRIVIGGAEIQVPFICIQYRMGELKHRARTQKPVQIIMHHDATPSAEACARVLDQRGISTHFIIDDQGVILQCLDPALDVGWHAKGHIRMPDGRVESESFNYRSIGIDLSNPVIPTTKAGKKELDRGQYDPDGPDGPRPSWLKPYPVQVEAMLALIRILRGNFKAITSDYRTNPKWLGDIDRNTPGIWGHCQVSKVKSDPWGFPFDRLSEVSE